MAAMVNKRCTLVVRVVRGPMGEVSGVLEHVGSGVKHAFEDRPALDRLIGEILSRHWDEDMPATG